MQSEFRGANLRNLKGFGPVKQCDFSSADLRGANLARLTDNSAVKSQFQGAKYDKNTRWPADFNPDAYAPATSIFPSGSATAVRSRSP